MYYVNWKECQDFIRELNRLTGKNFRLPTEAEWEYAARGGNKGNGCKYAGSDDISSVAWYTDNSGGNTHPVKGKSKNELGLYDMSGNVTRTACCAVVAGTTTRGTAECRPGATTTPTTGATAAGFASCFLS